MKKEIIDINESTIKQFVETLRPIDEEIRKQVDIGYSYHSKVKVVELYEIRPKWDNPQEIRKIFWFRADGSWEPYEPKPTATNLEEILTTIKEDKHGCFFG